MHRTLADHPFAACCPQFFRSAFLPRVIRRRFSETAIVRLGRCAALRTQWGTLPRSEAAARARSRIAPGLSPVISRNIRPKVPRLAQPVWKAIWVIGKWVSRSSAVARSIRRVSRYRCGGTPKASLNDRAKWAAETLLTRASRRTDQASCEAASIRSFARSRRRKSSGSWLAGASLSRTDPLPPARDTPGLVTTQSPPSARSFWSHGYNFPQKTARLLAPLPLATRNQRDKSTVFAPYHFSACRPAGNVPPCQRFSCFAPLRI